MLCSQGAAGVSCEFLDVTDPITVTTDDGQTVQMNSATSVVVDRRAHRAGADPHLRPAGRERLRRGQPAARPAGGHRPRPRRARPAACLDHHHHHHDAAALDHRDHPASGHDDRGSAAGRGPSITVGGDLAAIQYPPDGTIVVDDPVVQPGSDVAAPQAALRRTSNCRCSSTAGRSAPSSPTARATSPARCTSCAARGPGSPAHRARHGLRAERRHHGDGQPRAHGFVRPDLHVRARRCGRDRRRARARRRRPAAPFPRVPR